MATAAAATALPEKLANLARAEFEDTCQRRFFFGPSNDPYPATAGLFDFGPVMTAMKVNFLDIWRRHFIVPEGICEVDLPAVTPEQVFIASGHVERFADTIAKDSVTGECFRLDKLIEDWCEARLADKKTPADAISDIQRLAKDAGSLNTESLAAAVKKFAILSPKGNALTDPTPFNLMFKSHIGPEGSKVGYLRPELAQGIILNFKRLVDTGHAQRMPFGAACVGQAYRNEIAPRAALLRVREFTLAEIEWFCHPEDKAHPKIASVRDVAIWAWDKDQQYQGEVATRRTIGELLATGKMKNETLAYFLGRTALFLERIGITQYRFRQHRNDPVAREMAHYAQDCWDAECLTSYGWVECVGIADRSAYDLSAHITHSKKELTARVDYAEPKVVKKFLGKVDKAKCPKALGRNTGHFFEFVGKMSTEEATAFDAQLNTGTATVTNDAGETYTVTRELVSFEWKDVKETGYNYVPSVVEPSFGVGRILYALLEQSYWVRRDDSGKNDKRAVFSFKPAVAAYKVAVLPLMVKPVAMEKVARVLVDLGELAVPARSDDSGSAIGKKYARVDELGIPYAITVDFEEDNCVTLRERDTQEQVRVPIAEVALLVHDLCKAVNPRSWASVKEAFPAQAASAAA